MRQKKMRQIESFKSRRAQIEKMIQDNENKKIDAVLADFGIDLNNLPRNVEWLPIDLFDDIRFEDRTPQQWLDFFKDEKGEHIKITGKVAIPDSDDLIKWELCTVIDYNAQENIWQVALPDGEELQTERLKLLFDVEDPVKFGERLARAYVDRIYKDSAIRYEFYISNMPQDETGNLKEDSMRKIVHHSKNSRKLKESPLLNVPEEVDDVTRLYKRTMNKILFNKYLEEGGDKSSILPNRLILPDLHREPEEAPELGMMELNRAAYTYEPKGESYSYPSSKDFTEIFQEFCLETIMSKRCTLAALQDIRKLCIDVEKREVFNTKFSKELTYQEFCTLQETACGQLIYSLKNQWLNDIASIIKTNFVKEKEGWFCIPQATSNMTNYENGKLKSFLNLVKLQMQTTLRNLIEINFTKYVDIISNFVPETIDIVSVTEVINKYHDQQVVDSRLEQDYKRLHVPLFAIQVKIDEDLKIKFSQEPRYFKSTVTNAFSTTLKELGSIHTVEGKVLEGKGGKFNSYLDCPKMKDSVVDDSDIYRKPKDYVSEHAWIWDLFDRLDSVMKKAYVPLEDYIKKLIPFQEIMELKPAEFVAKYDRSDNPKPIEFILEEIKKYKEKEEKIEKEILPFIQVSCFMIDCRELIISLKKIYTDLVRSLTEIIENRYKIKGQDIDSKYKEIRTKIETDPIDIETLTEISQFIEMELPNRMAGLAQESADVMRVYDILSDMGYRVRDEADLDTRLNINYRYPTEIDELQDKRLEELKNKRKKKMYEDMREEQTKFTSKIDGLENKINDYHTKINSNEHKERFEDVNQIDTELKELVEKSRKFNSRESLFDKDQTDYSKIGRMIKEFEPYLNLWRYIHNWTEGIYKWNIGPWEQVDAIGAQNFVEDGSRILGQVARTFKDKDPLTYNNQISLAETYKKQIDEFKPKVPLLVALRSEGMQERHWKEISKRTGKYIDPTDSKFNFEWVLNHGFLADTNTCQEVGERASREYRIKKNLDEMILRWNDLEFKTIPYKNSNTMFLIQGFDEVETVLDEHMSILGAMVVNPYNKFYEKEILEWKDKMVEVSQSLDEWRRFQSKWAYLQPIFDGGDISRFLPDEATKFKQADKYAKFKADFVKKNPNALKACTEENTAEMLKQNNIILEDIQNALNQYLETKRSKFARFFFLSDDDLLSILSQTKDVERVQEHLRKVFENVNKLQFDKEKQIHAMFSVEGEKVNFVDILDPIDKQVEDWMSEVENQMKKSVREALLKAIQTYTSEGRVKWFFEHPGQCALNGSQVHWTKEVEEAIQKKKLKQYVEKLNNQLLEMVKLDRGNFSLMKNITIEALIVIDVHAKEVIEILEKSNITDVGAFEWISQLRYYWEKDDCYVKCIQTNFPYGYEYLGNTSRLVITPLTDKCYMTLMGAIKLNLGGAPAGPAGTGKTETTKDLAKALAKQCVVFNCQESMDYKFVAKFFKGLACSGAWCCFDEFNRINIEVLSVIAQQLQELFDWKARGITEERFEGTLIKILPTFSVFITMNPGYAGRTELPDNLKALFRPMAMMVPDYALIGQIKLYSFGFTTADILAKKMVTTFKLSSEQLSNQKHYDYGMRAVTSVINAAGLLKRRSTETNENKLLLRALLDVNVPKFLSDDIPLFKNIIKDLFPNVGDPTYEYGKLTDTINQACDEFKLQKIDVFLKKIRELYDTIQVRHGLMLVGGTGGGKTSNYKVLQRAISLLRDENPEKYKKVVVDIINPKSIDLAQLYGEAKDLNWDEGVIEIVAERAIKNQANDEYNWIMFDGPVDAIWIESMNTVLDDNKKLCLSSGKVLILSSLITMMFEVEDLAVASPATVSRCGMVYMEPGSMDIKIHINSYMLKIPDIVKEKKSFVSAFLRLIDSYVYPMLRFVRTQCKECIQTFDNNLISSFIKLFDVMAFNMRTVKTAEHVDELQPLLEQYVIFCLIWSICCTVDLEGRNKVNAELRKLMEECKCGFVLEESATIYDWQFVPEDKKWRLWTDEYASYAIDVNKGFSDIVIPTMDYARSFYLMKTLLTHKKHTLLPGPIGTGKSVNAFSLLAKGLNDEFTSLTIALSAQTKSSQILDSICSQVERRRKALYGPHQQKKCIVFVDDLNMPKKEEFGAQPPLELIRQYLDHKHWYVFKPNKDYFEFEDIVYLAAMGPPGGGRNFITNRLVRHFNVISYAELLDSTIRSIYQTILGTLMSRFDEPVRDMIEKLVTANINVYNESKSILLPKPGKSHYLFNLRDIAKAFQGICRGSQKYIKEAEDVVRIWYHENMRVYHDRLTTTEDRQQFIGMLRSQIRQMEVSPDDVINAERIIFADFMHGKETDYPPYYQVKDLKMLVKRIEEYLEDYNREMGAKKAMRLVMFLDACEHISRICRVLRLPNGHCLLMGVGGSGRQSLAKLSSYILDLKNFMIEVSKDYGVKEWRESLKTLIMGAVVENKPTCFIFIDTQIVNESMVEDVNCLLNSGAIIGLPLNPEEQKAIEDACKGDCIRNGTVPNKINMFNAQLNKVKKNTHVVMAMSPLSKEFATRLRMFPALINCCTLDWFTEWPDEALLGVAKTKIEDYVDEFKIKGTVDQIVDMFRLMHKSVENISVKYLAEMKRHNYVTPTSFLEQLNLYIQILRNKTEENKIQFKRFEDGLNKLQSAEEEVAKLKIKLIEDKPKLEKAEKEANVLIERLKKEKAEEDEKAKIIAQDEVEAIKQAAIANQSAKEAQQIKDESDMKLKEVLDKTKDLKKNQVTELRALITPPAGGKLVSMALCYMILDESKVKGLYRLNMDEMWAVAKKDLLGDVNELYKIVTESYNKENIDPKKIAMVEKNCKSEPNWTFIAANKTSEAVGLFFLWVNAMIEYNGMYLAAKPLRDKVEALMADLAEKEEKLRQEKMKLEESQAKLKKLGEIFLEKENEKENLQRKINECLLKLERAEKLTSLLADEKKRWKEEIITIKESEKLIPHDTLIAAGMVSYAGPFTAEYRVSLEKLWVTKLEEMRLPHTPGIRMTKFLGDGVKILEWNLAGLPKDETSIENGIIIDKSKRWPLMIDPQNQANKYIKSMGEKVQDRMDPIKASSPQLMQQLEIRIQNGDWALVENVGVHLDPSLEPILQRLVVTTGSTKTITVNNKPIPYKDGFRFFMTTTIPNPHYSPEISAKVTIINFGITPSGLEDQLLAKVTKIEVASLDETKERIVKENAANKRKLKECEDNILKNLSESTGDILMDESLIKELSKSKETSAQINVQMKESMATEIEIDKTRELYRPAAFRASILFFSINDLNLIDPMYQYALQWFINLFEMSIKNAPPHPETAQRLVNIIDYFTYSLYENVCRSLFEKHKLLFSFILTINIQQGENKINAEEFRYLLTGPTGEIKVADNPTDWIAGNSWPEIYKQFYGLDKLPTFKGVLDAFMKHSSVWKRIYDSVSPETEKLPAPWDTKLDQFQKVILIRSIRLDKMVNMIILYVTEVMGKRFVEPPVPNLSTVYKDSRSDIPIIFVLSAGSDPKSDFDALAAEMQIKTKLSISLGQGQGKKAEKMIEEVMKTTGMGGWVLLQNCHLAATWMPKLESICESFGEHNTHPDFRLWMTSMPTPVFPISVLQNSVKMTLEPPTGLKANLKLSYTQLDDKALNACKKSTEFKKLLFGLCFFHAVIQERRKFGAIGWNIPYEFTYEDLVVSRRQLTLFLDEYEIIPFKVLNFICAEINYGGRVTDDKDKRLIATILKYYMCPEVLDDTYKFSKSGLYFSPEAGVQADYLNYIESLPLKPDPEVFGLHENAEIITNQNQGLFLLADVQTLQTRSSGVGGKSREQIISETARFLQSKIPKPFDFELVKTKYDTKYEESMNTVLSQEVEKYNRLLEILVVSLQNILKALSGFITMDDELEKLADSLYNQRVPVAWGDIFLSLKPLMSWIEDLQARIKFLGTWIDKGTPNVFWISGFSFPQAFITGTLQNYARKHSIAIDRISFDFKYLDTLKPEDITQKPADGIYVYGVYLEGARWDYERHAITDPNPKELYSEMPLIWLIPKENREEKKEGVYLCPIYKVLSRAGTLSTTGHSTNFVMYFEVPSLLNQDEWVKAGVAGFLALRT
jgi:dynein heavy chain